MIRQLTAVAKVLSSVSQWFILLRNINLQQILQNLPEKQPGYQSVDVECFE